MRQVVKFPWKMSVFSSLGLLCSVIAFVLFMPTISTSAAMNRAEKAHAVTGCKRFEQDFKIAGPQGGMTPSLTKSSGCSGGVWVQFTKKSYNMNAMVCTRNSDGAVDKCESQQNWFNPTPFTDDTAKMVDTLAAGTQFSVLYTADGTGEPTGTGHIIVDY